MINEIINMFKAGQNRFVSWNLLFITCILIILAQVITLANTLNFTVSDNVVLARWLHAILALSVLIYIFNKKNKWNSAIASVLFVVLYVPFYFLSWFYHVDAIALPSLWIPFQNLHLHFFALAILVPGSYRINFFLIMGFVLESILLWFYLDLPNQPNVVMQTEPAITILYALVSLALLGFRYRDEKIIQQLYLKQAKAEVLETLACIFLSIRDKSNTPLQTLKISIDILKRKCPLDEKTISVLENSVNRLTFLGDILKMSEAKMEWKGLGLMTDEEINKWMNR